ncbi:syncoilin-like [Thalassophryne amazonica]|uniref:syncoilin-like n=1 Tax=Thalassophryne amazonica TaxID=390379 RepID=UPI0014717C17|nr:syncoilin-like [Thalassophryne amazonica]
MDNLVTNDDPQRDFILLEDSESETLGPSERCTPHLLDPADQENMERLEQRFDCCIQQVSRLEMQRDELIQELVCLHQPMLRVVSHLRGKVLQAQRLLSVVQLDHVAVCEEVQQVKKKLFTAARDCIHSQVVLATQEYQVAQSALTQDELKARVQTLTQDLTQLQEVHWNQLNSLRVQAHTPCRLRTVSDVSHGRQAAVRLQWRLSGSVRALESWYEPRLVVLLKRRQASADGLRKIHEQAEDLRAQLGPLREEVQRLEVQRAWLQQRLKLMDRDMEDDATQHKDMVEMLKDNLRELKVEFAIQQRLKKQVEELKDDLLAELKVLRGTSLNPQCSSKISMI